jgi:hypothetical protein
MGVPCTPVSTIEVAAGSGILVSLLAGVYTIAVDSAAAADYNNYKVYATEAARDADNPTPSAGDMAYAQDIDTRWGHDGTDWIILDEPEQSYTPTYANVTLGTSPTRIGTYRRSNGMLDFFTRLALGTGGALTGQPTVSMPSGITLGESSRASLAVQIVDGGSNVAEGTCSSSVAGDSVLTPLVWAAGSTYLTCASLSATVPMTWAVTDQLKVSGRIPMQTRYL